MLDVDAIVGRVERGKLFDVSLVLILSGLFAAAVGTWRSYAVARQAIGPLVHDGDETRDLIEANRPVVARARVRLFAHRLAVSLGWLAVAFYGLYLAVMGGAVTR